MTTRVGRDTCTTVGRRGVLGGAAAAALLAMTRPARALGRTPTGGTIAMTLPWRLDALDPHDPHDATAALFAHAVFDAPYATTEAGLHHPALAASMPERDGAGVVVHLRPGLRTAGGAAIEAREVVASLERARARGGAPLIEPLGAIRTRRDAPLVVTFLRADPAQVARALASPFAAIVPRGFDPARPDGTGAFAARLGGGGLVLTRNERAARGAAFLEAVEVRSSADLRATLRAFEIGDVDVGWLGSGLFGRRADAVAFDLGAAALLALVVGDRLGRHARGGGAQALCDGIPRDRLAHLGLGDLPPGEPAARWTGEPVDLCVESGAPHLLEIARAVAASLGSPDHEVTPRVLPRREVLARSRRDALGLVVVRPAGPGLEGARIALGHLDEPGRTRPLPVGVSPLAGSPRSLTGGMRVGVLGELRVTGGVARSWILERHPGGGWDLGASHRRRS